MVNTSLVKGRHHSLITTVLESFVLLLLTFSGGCPIFEEKGNRDRCQVNNSTVSLTFVVPVTSQPSVREGLNMG